MSKLVEQLKEYFENTSKEQLEKEYEEIYKKYRHVGPTVDEYLESIRQ